MATFQTAPSPNFLAAFDAAPSDRQVFLRKTYGLFTLTIVAAGAIAYAVSQQMGAMPGLAKAWPLWIAAWYGLQFLEGPISRMGSAGGLLLLGGFALVTGMLFGPVLTAYVAHNQTGIVLNAFALASVTFTGLTVYTLVKREDFSWMGGALSMACWGLIGVGLLSIFFPFPNAMSLGISVIAVVIMSGIILLETSNILHHYGTHQGALAAARLFTAFFVLFLHLLRILSSKRN